SLASPTPTNNKESTSGGGAKLATAGIVVGSVVVAAAIGIWVFRKWKLSPSRDFQSKIRGDDYQDYPRSYESDTVFLRNLGDQPTEAGAAAAAAATKASPYNNHAQVAVNVDDQYYDPVYTNADQAGGPVAGGGAAAAGGYGYGYDQQGGYNNQAAAGGYDHQAYGGGSHHGYDAPYGHAHEYAESQVGSGHGGSGHGGSQVAGGGYNAGSNVGGGGYAGSNVGGGYQHQGYDDYGRR
ncbi:hypothetical protein BGZ65_012247, partial [Modicella reniformis]